MSITLVDNRGDARNGRNRLLPEDRAVHDWYRFVLSFPPHLVRDYVDRFGIRSDGAVLDPFCGTGTTLIECKKLGIASVGIESNPMAYFASSVKVDWSIDSLALIDYAEGVAAAVRKDPEYDRSGGWNGLPLFQAAGAPRSPMRGLGLEQSKLLLKDSISPAPLHKTLVLLDIIERHGDRQLRQYGRLALANALVRNIGNLKFGPEVGVGKVKDDAPVLEAWLDCMRTAARDISLVGDRAHVPAQVHRADSREADTILEPNSARRRYQSGVREALPSRASGRRDR